MERQEISLIAERQRKYFLSEKTLFRKIQNRNAEKALFFGKPSFYEKSFC